MAKGIAIERHPRQDNYRGFIRFVVVMRRHKNPPPNRIFRRMNESNLLYNSNNTFQTKPAAANTLFMAIQLRKIPSRFHREHE